MYRLIVFSICFGAKIMHIYTYVFLNCFGAQIGRRLEAEMSCICI